LDALPTIPAQRPGDLFSGRFPAIGDTRLLLRADRVPGGDPDPICIPGKFIESAFEGTELVLIAPVVGNAIFEQGAEDLLLERIVEKVNYMFAQRCLRESSDSGRARDELEGSTLP